MGTKTFSGTTWLIVWGQIETYLTNTGKKPASILITPTERGNYTGVIVY